VRDGDTGVTAAPRAIITALIWRGAHHVDGEPSSAMPGGEARSPAILV